DDHGLAGHPDHHGPEWRRHQHADRCAGAETADHHAGARGAVEHGRDVWAAIHPGLPRAASARWGRALAGARALVPVGHWHVIPVCLVHLYWRDIGARPAADACVLAVYGINSM